MFLAEEIKKSLYQYRSAYETFWLDKKYCKQLNKMLKKAIEEKLSENDMGWMTQWGHTYNEDWVKELSEEQILKEQEKKKKEWMFVYGNAGAQFVGDLEEVQKDVKEDLRGWRYYTSYYVPWVILLIGLLSLLVGLLTLARYIGIF